MDQHGFLRAKQAQRVIWSMKKVKEQLQGVSFLKSVAKLLQVSLDNSFGSSDTAQMQTILTMRVANNPKLQMSRRERVDRC